ncbi:peptidylprolyl isomerase [Candidatus Dependentiae bacterium]|nr:peptidylprolyl isomerase [Candidatus Dependentiae bacterium]
MIALIRKKFKKRGMQVIAGITLISIIGADFVRRQGSKTYQSVATVNGYEITPSEFRKQVMEEERRLSYIQEQFGKDAKAILAMQGINTDPQEAALDKLVREKLILSAADKLKINPSPEFISQKFSDPNYMYKILSQVIPMQLLSQEGFNLSQLSYYLRKQGISMSQFEEMIETLIKRFAVFDAVQGALYVPETVLKEHFAKNYLKKRLSILTFDFEKYLNKAKKDQLTEEQIKSYFESKNKKYWIPEKRSGIVWKIDSSSYGLKVTDREIENYFEKNKAEFKDKKLNDVKTQVQNKLLAEKFERLFTLDAQRIMSESRKNPEVLTDFVNSKKAVKTIIGMTELSPSTNIQKLFSLRPNQKAYYIENGAGYFVELANIAPSFKPDLNSVKQTVIEDIYKDNAKKLMLTDLEKANDEIKSSSLESIASKFDVKLQKTDWISTDAKKIDLLEKLKVPMQMVTAFSQKGMHLMYPGKSNDMNIIYLSDIEAFDENLFAQKKAEFIKEIYQEQASQIIYSFIDSLLKNAKIKYNLKTA